MFATLAVGAISTPPLALTGFAAETAAETLVTKTPYEAALAAYTDGDMAMALAQGLVAAEGGNAEAQVLVGHMLMRGEAGTINNDQATKWFLKAAQLGQTDAMVALAELAIKSHGGLSPTDAFKWLEKASDMGRTDAMRALAEIYIKGKGTVPDIIKGREWLVKASNSGDVIAEASLGDLLFETAPVEALAWYEKAANNGDADSAYIVAIMYAENFEIKPDSIKAGKFLSQAAEAGIPAAQADYGLIVYQGNGVPKSAERAAAWFKRAAMGGDPEGRFLYAFTLAKGDGVAQSYEDAYYWLLRADQDSGKTGVDDYDRSRTELRARLESNVDAAILQRARKRATSDKLLGINTP